MDTLTYGTQRLIHLDLKGAPPKLSYFEKFFPFVKEIGATGLLIEWEDTFPFTRELVQIGGLSNSAQTTGAPYTIEEAQQILELAADCDLTVIPLIQTFGHLEYVLKHEQWHGLREVELYPSSICPSNSETMPLIRSMIKQIVAFHPNIQYIHIGADEVWHLGVCLTCSKRVQSSKYGKAAIYLDHVTEIAQYIKENYPNLKIIIWDDMLRNIDIQILQEQIRVIFTFVSLFLKMPGMHLGTRGKQLVANLYEFFEQEKANGGSFIPVTAVRERVAAALKINQSTVTMVTKAIQNGELLDSKKRIPKKPVTVVDEFTECAIRNEIYRMYDNHYYIGSLVEPMVWHYNDSGTFNLGSALWDKYCDIFTSIWAATAFKGASGGCQLLPDNHHHVSNHEAWLSELGMHGGKIKTFRGAVFTGWSRYDHYATLCELLPCSIPSLCLCLKTWLCGGCTPEVFVSIEKILSYTDSSLKSIIFNKPSAIASQLNFPGWQIMMGFEWFCNIRTKYRSIIDSDQMSTWFNQWQVLNNYTNPMQIESILTVVTELYVEASSLENFLKGHLEYYFFTHTIEELIGTLIDPIKQHLHQLKFECEAQIATGCRIRGHKRLNI